MQDAWGSTYHYIPDELLGLGVEGLIPGSDRNILGSKQVENLKLKWPEAPAPVLAIFVRLLRVVQRAHVPCVTTIQCHLHACHFLPTSCLARNTRRLVSLQLEDTFPSKKRWLNLFATCRENRKATMNSVGLSLVLFLFLFLFLFFIRLNASSTQLNFKLIEDSVS